MRAGFCKLAIAAKTLKSSRFSIIFSRNFFTVSTPLFSGNAFRRKPIRVLNKKGEPLPTTTNLIEENNSSARERWSLVRRSGNQEIAAHLGNQPVLKYKKIADFQVKFGELLMNVKCKDPEVECNKILLEGVRLINDALKAGIKSDMILFSKKEILSKLHMKDPEDVKLYKVLYKSLQVWSDLKTCPGIMGIFKKPSGEDQIARSENSLPVSIICHNITDPGTLGSIIRSSAAVGCKAVFIMKDCVDVWMHKVLRSGCGAQFRIPIVSEIEWTHILNYIPQNSSIFLINSVNNSKNVNECFFNFADEDENSPNRYYTETEDKESLLIDEKYEDWYDLQSYANVTLPNILYTDTVFPKNDIVLVVSDENLPINLKAIKLGCEFGAKQLNFPFENKVQRISSVFSLSVVLYEIRRQMAEKYVL